MVNLIASDENIKSSCVYIGHLVLKALRQRKDKKISVFEIIDYLKRTLKIIHYRQLIFALIFLYSLDLIDFRAPYIYKRV